MACGSATKKLHKRATTNVLSVMFHSILQVVALGYWALASPISLRKGTRDDQASRGKMQTRFQRHQHHRSQLM
jgi:hypothetical protein